MATIDYKQKIKDYMNSSEVDTLYKSMLNNLFPELAESEDERIRKRIIHALHGDVLEMSEIKEAVDWLEKQAKQKPFDYEKAHIQQNDFAPKSALEALKGEKVDNANKVEQKPDEEYNITGISSNKSQGKLGEIIKNLKTTWSEEDEKMINNLYQVIDEHIEISGDTRRMFCNWLKSLKDRVQPKQEWSEEDEKMLGKCIDAASGYYSPEDKQSMKDWLYSIKDIHTWKPSDEQMKQLGWVVVQNKDNVVGKELMVLYNDLEKLKS